MQVPSPAKGCTLRVRGCPVSAQRDLCVSFLEHGLFFLATSDLSKGRKPAACSLQVAMRKLAGLVEKKGGFSFSLRKSHSRPSGKLKLAARASHTLENPKSIQNVPPGLALWGCTHGWNRMDEAFFLKGGLASIGWRRVWCLCVCMWMCACVSVSCLLSWLNWCWAQCLVLRTALPSQRKEAALLRGPHHHRRLVLVSNFNLKAKREKWISCLQTPGAYGRVTCRERKGGQLRAGRSPTQKDDCPWTASQLATGPWMVLEARGGNAG